MPTNDTTIPQATPPAQSPVTDESTDGAVQEQIDTNGAVFPALATIVTNLADAHGAVIGSPDDPEPTADPSSPAQGARTRFTLAPTEPRVWMSFALLAGTAGIDVNVALSRAHELLRAIGEARSALACATCRSSYRSASRRPPPG
jgi:hypothetical protein